MIPATAAHALRQRHTVANAASGGGVGSAPVAPTFPRSDSACALSETSDQDQQLPRAKTALLTTSPHRKPAHHPAPPRDRSFRTRYSKLDMDRLMAERDEFRGFYVMFWVSIAFYAAWTVLSNLQSRGILFSLDLWHGMTRGIGRAILTDLKMVSTLFGSMVLTYLHAWRLISPTTGAWLQISYETAFVLGWVSSIYRSNYYWTQTSFLVLHTLSNFFKIHSYNSTIRKLAAAEIRRRHLLRTLISADLSSSTSSDSAPVDPATEAANYAELDHLEAVLCPHGTLRYPAHVSLTNFADYLICPTVVYELEYPRTECIRWRYVAVKAATGIAAVSVMFLTVESHVLPIVSKPQGLAQFPGAVLHLFLPFIAMFLMTFIVLFESACNGLAELSCFADRHFYDDWYNSSTFEQFARKWNRPVHEFLHRHVYLELHKEFAVPKPKAQFLTFLFSSVLHEAAIFVITRKFRMYFFVMQMFQLVLIWAARHPLIRRHPVAGNAFFWFGMFLMIPTLTAGYCWY
ncbi:MBOAT, membrane-bound O-acyltransferase family-domain-containing protein [Blastocladiella britannica]|nr:MBOAT, membrane-bound O-acyltransferase family-domain-containing protein [Blastocladiella britannica]